MFCVCCSLEALEQLTEGVDGNSKRKFKIPVANCLSSFITTGDSVKRKKRIALNHTEFWK